MTEQDLADIQARVQAATPGPWKRRAIYEGDVGYIYTLHPKYRGQDIGIPKNEVFFSERLADSEFIAHAREDVPALLAEVERLREIVGKVAQLRALEIGFKRDVMLASPDINVLWVLEKAKEALQ